MYGPPPPVYDQPRYSSDQLGYPYSPSAPAQGFHSINPTVATNPTQTQARYSTDGHPSSTPAIPSVHYSPSPVYSGQSPAIVRFPGSAAGRDWSTGLCHCCDDPAICFITCLCPCITFGQIADIVSEGSNPCTSSGMAYGLLCLTGCASLYSCFYRSKLRAQYDLPEEPCADCLVHFCCETCALRQEHRELKNRGLDMGIGWEANMERKKRGLAAIPPQVPPGMTR